MGFMISPEVDKYITYARKAWIDFGLKEQSDFPPGKIEQLKKEYTRSVWKSGYGKEYDDRKQQYKDNTTVKIGLDYFILNFTNSLFDVLRNSESNTLNLGLMSEVDKHLEAIGAHSLARYMGKSLVPEFVDDVDLFKKMLWLEWVLQQSVSMVNLGIIPDMYIPMVGGPGKQLESRLESTGKFLDTYVSKHPEYADNLKNFRASYFTKTMDKSQAKEALGAIDRSFEAASKAAEWMRPKKPVAQSEAVSSTAAMLAANVRSDEVPPEQKAPLSTEVASSNAKSVDEQKPALKVEEDSSLEEEDVFHDVFESFEAIEEADAKEKEESQIPQSPQINTSSSQINTSSSQTNSSEKQTQVIKASQAVNSDKEFDKVQSEVINAINAWIATPASDRPKNIVYDLDNDTERATQLMDKLAKSKNLDDFEKTLATFIKKGETQRDKTIFTFSRLEAQGSLRNVLATKFCPGVFNHTTEFLGRKKVNCDVKKIVELLDFPSLKKQEKLAPRPTK